MAGARLAGSWRREGWGSYMAPVQLHWPKVQPLVVPSCGQEGQEAGASLTVFGFSDTQEVAQVTTSNQR